MADFEEDEVSDIPGFLPGDFIETPAKDRCYHRLSKESIATAPPVELDFAYQDLISRLTGLLVRRQADPNELGRRVVIESPIIPRDRSFLTSSSETSDALWDVDDFRGEGISTAEAHINYSAVSAMEETLASDVVAENTSATREGEHCQ